VAGGVTPCRWLAEKDTSFAAMVNELAAVDVRSRLNHCERYFWDSTPVGGSIPEKGGTYENH